MAGSVSKEFSMLERLLAYFESESEQLELLQTIDPSEIPGLSFMCMITYEGVPILPPVVNSLRKEEMLIYKRQSLQAESRLRAKSRQKLLEKVQMVMNEIEQRHGRKRTAESTSPDAHMQSSNTAPFINQTTDHSHDEKPEPEAKTEVDEEQHTVEDSGIDSKDNVSTLVAEKADTVQEVTDISDDSNHSTPRDSTSGRELVQQEANATFESTEQVLDDSDLEIPGDASQGLLLLRQKLEGQSTEADLEGPHLILSREKTTSTEIPPNTETRSAVHSQEEVNENCKDRDSSFKKVDTVTKRLPTFLRIQESLNRKLNSTVSGQSIAAERNSDTLAENRSQTCPPTLPNADPLLGQIRNEESVDRFSVASDSLHKDMDSRFAVTADSLHNNSENRTDGLKGIETGHKQSDIIKELEHVPTQRDTPELTNNASENVAFIEQISKAATDTESGAAENAAETTAEGRRKLERTSGSTVEGVAVSVSTSNSLASGNTFGSDEMNRTVISQEESKSKNTTTETIESEDSHRTEPSQPSFPNQSTTTFSSSNRPEPETSTTTDTESHEHEQSLPDLNLQAVPQTPPRDSNKENLNPKLPPLLSRVALNVDLTPDCTPHKGRAEQFFAQPSPESWISKASVEEKNPYGNADPFKTSSLIRHDDSSEAVPSPGPLKTPNLSTISYADSIEAHAVSNGDTIQVKPVSDDVSISNAIKQEQHISPPTIVDPFVKSAETHELYTESTELAQYMATSMDTMQSFTSTLPHGGADRRELQFHPGSNLQQPTSSLSRDSQVHIGEQVPNTHEVSSPHLRGSYTLDHPSPALIASHAPDVTYEQDHGQVIKQGQSRSPNEAQIAEKSDVIEKPTSTLTSSMEDLNIRPVHRRLDYQADHMTKHMSDHVINHITDHVVDHEPHHVTSGIDNLKITPLPPENEPELPTQPFLDAPTEGQFQHQGHPGVSPFEAPVPFDVLQQDQREAERSGKQEHLQRYLDNLSQMPSVAASKAAQQQPLNNHYQPEPLNQYQPGLSSGLVMGQDGSEVRHDIDAELGNIADDEDEEFENESDQEEFLTMQRAQFELQRQQLLEEQRLQLVQLMAEQDRKQRLYEHQMQTHAQQRKSQEKRPTSRRNQSSMENSQQTDTSISQPQINQNQLLASLAQLLGQQALGESQQGFGASHQGFGGSQQVLGGSQQTLDRSLNINASMQHGLPTNVSMPAVPMSLGSNVSHAMTMGSQMNSMPGYTSLPVTANMTHSAANVSQSMGRHSQMSQAGQLRNAPFMSSAHAQNYGPDSHLSTASTLTSQDLYYRTEGTVSQSSTHGLNSHATNRNTETTYRNMDGTLSQASTLPHEYLQRPYSALVPPVNYSMDGAVQYGSPARDTHGGGGGHVGLNFSPAAIAKLLAQAGLKIPVHNETEEGAQQRHYEEVCRSPAVLGGGKSKQRSPMPQPLQSVFNQQANLADTSINSSDRSVHFASPVHVTAYLGADQSIGDTSHNSSRQYHDVSAYDKEIPYELHQKFVKVTAIVKGYLVRRLMKTDKIQGLIKSLSDTAEFALKFQQESPVKRGVYSEQDKRLQQRVLHQITANMYEIHDTFFRTTARERMEIIAQDRMAQREKLFKTQTQHIANEKRLSTATVKKMERQQKALLAEASVPPQSRPKSAPPPSTARCSRSTDDRALKPLQARTSPIKPLKTTNRVQHKDPNIKTAPRKTHVQTRPSNSNKTKSKQTVTSTAAKKSSIPAKQPVRKIARHVASQPSQQPSNQTNTATQKSAVT